MTERFWIIGAFTTSLFGSALIALLIFIYIRTQSRFVLAYFILILGGVFHLVGEMNHLLPDWRILGRQAYYGYALFASLGAGLTTFGLPAVAMELVGGNHRSGRWIFPAFPALIAAWAMGFGIGTGREILVTVSPLLESGVGFVSVLAILLGRKGIHSARIRRMATVISLVCLAILPLSETRLLMKLLHTGESVRSLGFLGAAYGPSHPQLVLMFLMVTLSLITGSRELIDTAQLHRDVLDSDAVYRHRISARERDIITHIADGYSNEEIGRRLYISESTVKNHIYHIYKKIGVHNRVELLNAVMKEE